MICVVDLSLKTKVKDSGLNISVRNLRDFDPQTSRLCSITIETARQIIKLVPRWNLWFLSLEFLLHFTTTFHKFASSNDLTRSNLQNKTKFQESLWLQYSTVGRLMSSISCENHKVSKIIDWYLNGNRLTLSRMNLNYFIDFTSFRVSIFV